MSLTCIEAQGSVTRVETVGFKSLRQLRLGFPKQVTLVDIAAKQGKTYRGFVWGEDNGITPGDDIEALIKRNWYGDMIYHIPGVMTELIQRNALQLQLGGVLYNEIQKYKIIG